MREEAWRPDTDSTIDITKNAIKRARMTLEILRRMEDFRKLPKKARDAAIQCLHIGRRAESDMGFAENADACERAIKLLEAVANEQEKQTSLPLDCDDGKCGNLNCRNCSPLSSL